MRWEKFLLQLLLMVVCGLGLFAQPGSKPAPLKPADLGIQSKKALSFYEDGLQQMKYRDYPAAIRAFQKAIEQEPNFAHAHFQTGVATYLINHVQTRTGYYLRDEVNAVIPPLEKAVALKPESFPSAYFYLGEAYLHAVNYEKARDMYKKFLGYNGQNLPDVQTAQNKIKVAEFGAEAIKKPLQFDPVNLGDSINTDGEEYMPFLTADGQTLFFTSRRPGCVGGFNNYYQSYLEDFYIAYLKNGQWTEAQNLGSPINTEQNEGAATFSQDGQMIIFSACERKDGQGNCDLYWSRLEGDTWSPPKNLGAKVNSPFWESQPSLAHDNKTLYFASTRPNGVGKNDIWVSRLENGQWTEAQNLGTPVNTPGNEYYPFMHADGISLYFASDFHPGFGGLDLFISQKSNDGFGSPVNLGYPLNGPGEEHSIYVSPSGKVGYFSSTKLKGKGGFDIWRFNLDPKIQPQRTTYLRGYVFDSLSGNPVKAKVTLIDLESQELVRKVESNGRTGLFVLSLPLGKKYGVFAEAKGYLFYSQHFALEVPENQKEYELLVKLQATQKDATIILKNVFFDTDSYKLKPESYTELDKLTTLLKENPGISIELRGHTDNTASETHNLTLSDNRAKAVRSYLIEKGIAESRLTAKGYGEKLPIASNQTAEGKALNRRTEFKITAVK